MQARRRSDSTPRHSVRLAATVRLDSERAALVVHLRATQIRKRANNK